MTEWIKNKVQQYAAYKRFTSAFETCEETEKYTKNILNEEIEKYTLCKLLKGERGNTYGEKKKTDFQKKSVTKLFLRD